MTHARSVLADPVAISTALCWPPNKDRDGGRLEIHSEKKGNRNGTNKSAQLSSGCCWFRYDWLEHNGERNGGEADDTSCDSPSASTYAQPSSALGLLVGER
jgi:hypothetical protein